jgi:DNA-directed RNA polymerase III subunit RPC1
MRRDHRMQGYFGATLKVLQAICKCCSRALLTDAQRMTFLKALRGRRRERNAGKHVFKAVLLECKKARQCPHCLGYNGPVRKMAASFKVLHDPFCKKV